MRRGQDVRRRTSENSILRSDSRDGQERNLFGLLLLVLSRFQLYPRLGPFDSTKEFREPKRTGLMDEVPHEVSVVREDRGESSREEESGSVEMSSEESFYEPGLERVWFRGNSLTRETNLRSIRSFVGAWIHAGETHFFRPIHSRNLDPTDLREPPTPDVLRAFCDLLPVPLERVEPHAETFLLELEILFCPHSNSNDDPDNSQSTESTHEEILIVVPRNSNDWSIRVRQDDIQERHASRETTESHS